MKGMEAMDPIKKKLLPGTALCVGAILLAESAFEHEMDCLAANNHEHIHYEDFVSYAPNRSSLVAVSPSTDTSSTTTTTTTTQPPEAFG